MGGGEGVGGGVGSSLGHTVFEGLSRFLYQEMNNSSRQGEKLLVIFQKNKHQF